MIKIENVEVVGLEPAIRGMRNPKDSFSRSDSYIGAVENEDGSINWEEQRYYMGENDHNLAMQLVKGGPVHAKFRRMINVYVDITAPLYWWSEFDTYKVGTVANSCSKMHRLLSKPFEMSCFSFDKLVGYKKKSNNLFQR